MIKQLDIRRWHPDSRGKHEQDRSNSYLGSKISPAAELHRMRMGLFVLISGNLVNGDTATLVPSLEPKTEGQDRRGSIGKSNSASNARPCLGISISRSNANRLSAGG